jgi:drug/metabolite transporter (DMT)-like permease
MKKRVTDKTLNITGFVWCVMAGLSFGAMNLFAKLAYNDGLTVSRFIVMRFAVLAIGSYLFGRFSRGVNFDIRLYDKKQIKLIVIRALITIVAKAMQYTSILIIPVSVASCISFAAGPIIAYLVAFMLIREKLSVSEVIPMVCGIIGTFMITMPQWFLWTGIDSVDV